MTFFSFILLMMIVYSIFKRIWKGAGPERKNPPPRRGDPVVEEMKQDPVCGTYVPASLAVTSIHKGATVYFCSDACRDKFTAITKKS